MAMATTEDGSQAPSALYLGNLPPSANQSSVKIFCHGAGCPTVMNVSMKQKKNADVVNKYAFVHFRDHDSARIAFVLLSNKSMDDNKLIINWSHHTTTASAKDADNAKKNGKAAGVSASAGGGQIISWKCKDPSCGNINPPSKNACAKCNLPQNIKLAQRKKEKSSQDAKSSKSASKATSDGAAAAGGKGHGQKAQARLEKIRQGKDDNKTGSSQKQEQTARPSIDKHLAAIFKIKAEIAENKASLKCDTHSEMVEVATEALHKMPDFALQGGWLLEDYTKLRKEMTFYQKWKTELTELEDSSLGAMKELAFNGAAKGLANSIDKYLTSFPHAEMKTVLEGIDDNLGVILDKHLNLLNTEPVEDWDKKAETSAASIYRKSAKTDQTGTAEDAFRTLSQAINDLKAAIDDGCPTPALPKLEEVIPKVRKTMEAENRALLANKKDELSSLRKSVASLKWARQRLLSLFISYEKVYELALEIEKRHGSDALSITDRLDEIPTYSSFDVDSRSVEAKFSKFQPKFRDEPVKADDSDGDASEPGHFSDAEEDLVTVDDDN